MLRALVYSNVYVSVCAASLVVSTYVQLGTRPRLDAAVGLVFFATLLTYNLDRIAGTSPEDEDASSARLTWIASRRGPLVALCALGALGSAACALLLPWHALLALAPLAVVTLGYSMPILPAPGGPKRLKDLPGFKIVLIALVWALATVSVPAWARGLEPWSALPVELAVERALFIFAITLPFDVRDLARDRAGGVITLPGVLGVRATKALATSVLVGLGAWAAWRRGLAFGDASAGVALACGLSALLLGAMSEERSEDYYAIGVEGTMLAYTALSVASAATGW